MKPDREQKTDLRIIKEREFSFLKRELSFWCQSKLLNEEQAAGIEALYSPASGLFAQVILVLGGMLVGLGILSAIAANWWNFSRLVRVIVVLKGYVIMVLTAWRCEKNHPILSKTFLFLSSFLYGAGIFLIAQIFNDGGHWLNALAWWMTGILMVIIVFRDEFQLMLLQALSFVYLWGHWFESEYWSSWHYGELTSVYDFLKAVLDSPGPLLIVISLWCLWFYMDKNNGFVLRFGSGFGFNLNLALTLNFTGLYLTRYLRAEVMVLIALACLGLLLSIFAKGNRRNTFNTWGILLVGICCLILSIPDIWRFSSLGDTLSSVNSLLAEYHISPSIASALIASIYMIWQIYMGYAMGSVFFCLFVLRYYFDTFYDFMPKAMFFIIGGVILIALGFFIEKIRRSRAVQNDAKSEIIS